MKVFRTFIIIITGLLSVSFADDCKIASDIQDVTDAKNFSFIGNVGGVNYEGILPAEAIAKAVENLKRYCCTSKILGDEYCANFKDDTEQKYPQSAYLYDQLLDVAFRRLDGRADLAYGLAPDKDGKAWRDAFNTFATDKVATSKEISDEYKKYRTEKVVVVNDKDLDKFIPTYNSATLADKYATTCLIIEKLYEQVRTDKKVVIDPSYKKGFHAKCLKLANNRIVKEYTATQALMIKASNESLHITTQAYTMKYFMQEKMANLLTLINKLRGLFSTLVQQSAASKTCSK